MRFEFVLMNFDYANQIKNWQYNGVVESISVDAYFNSYQTTGKMTGPAGCIGFAVFEQSKLAGLFEYYFENEVMSIGLALAPELVGKGYGTDFVKQGVEFGLNHFKYNGEYIKLTVNVQNKPAIRIYEKIGFKEYNRKDKEIEMRLNLKDS